MYFQSLPWRAIPTKVGNDEDDDVGNDDHDNDNNDNRDK